VIADGVYGRDKEVTDTPVTSTSDRLRRHHSASPHRANRRADVITLDGKTARFS